MIRLKVIAFVSTFLYALKDEMTTDDSAHTYFGTDTLSNLLASSNS